MSLINDALKKAQHQRTGDTPPLGSVPGVGGESANRISRRTGPSSSGVPYAQLGVALGVVVLLVVGGIFLARYLLRGAGEPTATRPAIVAQAAPPSASPVAPVDSGPAKPVPVPPSAFVLPIIPPSNLPPAKAAAVAAAPAPAVTAPVVQPEPAKPAGPAPKVESKAVAYIEGLKIAGVRISATDSKVLMNDRVYRVGYIVEHDMGLKLTAITTNSLTFEDERGATYTRNF